MLRKAASQLFKINLAISVTIVLGIVIRLFRFIENRSLDGDELAIALNITDRTLFQLFSKPLSYEQHAPFGFLFLVKCIESLFGMSEYALRTIPLLSGVVALYIFSILVKKVLTPTLALVALVCFSFNRDLIYYSATLKQYETETLVCIVLILAYLKWHNSSATKHFLLWGVVGTISVWFSYSAVFILAATGTSAIIKSLVKKGNIYRLGIMFAFWLSGFTAVYFLFMRSSTSSQWLENFWEDKQAFAPLPNSLANMMWYASALLKLVSTPLSLKNSIYSSIDYKLNIVPVLLLLIGFIHSYKKKINLFLPFLLVFLFILLASFMHVYPFSGRLLLFLTPICILLILFGVQMMLDESHFKIPPSAIYNSFVCIFIALFLLYPSFANLTNNGKNSQARESLNIINKKRKPDNSVYIQSFLHTAYLYYNKIYRYDWSPIISTPTYGQVSDLITYKERIKKDIKKLPAKTQQVWVLTTNLYSAALQPTKDRKLVTVSTSTEESVIVAAVAETCNCLVERVSYVDPESVFLVHWNQDSSAVLDSKLPQ